MVDDDLAIQLERIAESLISSATQAHLIVDQLVEEMIDAQRLIESADVSEGEALRAYEVFERNSLRILSLRKAASAIQQSARTTLEAAALVSVQDFDD